MYGHGWGRRGSWGARAFFWFASILCGAWFAGVPGDWAPQAVAQDDELTDDLTGIETGTRGQAAPAASGPKVRTLLDTLFASGIVGLVIILLSMVSLAFIIEHFLTIRKTALMPEAVVQEVEELIHRGDVAGAIQACRDPANQCLFADVVLAGLERFQASEFGFAEYRAAVEEAGEDQTARLYRKTEVLNVIGAIAPMLGLLGTVQGMIIAFNTIASTEGAAKPYQLADAISLSLVTTFEGLVVAIPTMAAFSYFRSRIDSIVAEAGKRIEQAMMPLGRRR